MTPCVGPSKCHVTWAIPALSECVLCRRFRGTAARTRSTQNRLDRKLQDSGGGTLCAGDASDCGRRGGLLVFRFRHSRYDHHLSLPPNQWSSSRGHTLKGGRGTATRCKSRFVCAPRRSRGARPLRWQPRRTQAPGLPPRSQQSHTRHRGGGGDQRGAWPWGGAPPR